jgi:hypothetical protein
MSKIGSDDFAARLKSYRVSRVTGDRYKHSIAYDLAKQTKSELFAICCRF